MSQPNFLIHNQLHMEPDIRTALDEQNQKIDAILVSVKRTERNFKITMWVTLITFVLPLIILIFVVPIVMGSYLSTINGLI